MDYKNIIIYSLSIFPLIFSAIVMTSCSKNEGEIIAGDDNPKEEEVILTLSADNISVDAAAGQEFVQLTTNADWHIENTTSQYGWCSISPVSGKAGTVALSIDIQANGYDKREHVFNIKAGNEEVSLTVTQKQLGFFQFVVLDTNGTRFYDEGGICNVSAATSLEYDIEYTDNGGEWISRTATKALTQETISFTIAEYAGSTQRECDIIFKEKGGELRDTVHVIQYHDKIVEFEDNNFKYYCLSKYDKNNDGEITKRETFDINTIEVSNPIVSLRGIEEFENLMFLTCNDVGLSDLDLSKNAKLLSLDCDDNSLTSLDLSNNPDLQSLSCDNNELAQLIIADQDWVSLSCENNLLTSLGTPDFPVKVLSLYCADNRLEDLYITRPSRNDVFFSGLSFIDCKNNNLIHLNLSSYYDCLWLNCTNNNLAELDIKNLGKLSILYCDSNKLTKIVMPNNSLLKSIDISNNNLTEIDISDCIYLNQLKISYNDISSLDVSKLGSLTSLYCDNNPLQSITISSSQENADWMSSSYGGIKYWYPDIEVIIK